MSDKEPPPTPKSKLETLSREDLIRFAKKQAIAAKQLREKNEELEKSLNTLTVETRQHCDAIVQTMVPEDSQEECQWLRMALSVKQDDVRGNEESASTNVTDEVIAKADGSTQTTTDDDDDVEASLVSVECQTDVEGSPAPTPPVQETNPDAMKEAKMQLQLLAAELDSAKQELSSQSLWKLEMEDTERSFAKLQSELRETAAQLNGVQKENALLSDDVRSLKQRLETAEKEGEEVKKKLKESEMKVKDLQSEDNGRKLELDRMKEKLERAEGMLEKTKLETASDASVTEARLAKLQTTLDDTKGRLEKAKNAKTILEKQVEDLQNEYTAYRTRVHSVLKQERKSAATSGAENNESSMAEQYRKADQQLITSLREQLEKSKHLYESCRCDLERIRDQHDQLYERHRMLRVHADQVESQWKLELEAMRSDAARVARLHAEQIRTLTSDKRDLQRDFERRIEDLLAERREHCNGLEQRIAELEDEITTLKRQSNHTKWDKDDGERSGKEEHAGRRRGKAESVEYAPRPPAEGAENADVAKKPYQLSNFNRGDLEYQRSLEDLIGDQQSVHSFEASNCRTMSDEDTLAKLHHLTELLSESEANNSRLSEQIKVLKDEIRRLERNTERSEHVANAEYLKNVVMQFLNPSMRDRRERLLPVLTTLLRLSPDEVTVLMKEASADNPSSSSGVSSAWGGYIHRWSGLN